MDEVDTYYRLRSDPEVAGFLYSYPMTRDEAESKLRSCRSVITEPGQWLNVAVEVAATGEVAGDVGIEWTSDIHRLAEIGYTLFADHRGRGYATEAGTAMVGLAFTGLGAHRVCGHLDDRSTASARVLERLGMRFEAHFVENEWVKGEWTDDVVYAVIAPEWAARQSRRSN